MKMEMIFISTIGWYHRLIIQLSTHIVVLWIPRPQNIANASNIDISQFVNCTPFAWTYTRTPMTFFCPFLIGMHKIHFDSCVISSLKLLVLYSLWLFIHSAVSFMFKISPVLATYWAIWAKIELLISSIDGRPFDVLSSLPCVAWMSIKKEIW